MHISRRLLIAAVFLASLPVQAAERRALLVGIDRYIAYPREGNRTPPSELAKLRLKAIHGSFERRSIPDLGGAVNDAAAMKEILIDRFGFEERNIILLTNEQATGDRVLTLLQTHLIDSARPGDVSLFYFAGHGSRIRNTAARNKNSSGYDSTLVPADSLLGVPDLRSKELARIYNQAPRKGVILTVIHDSCYSGAASRGPITARRVRAMASDPGLSVNDPLNAPLPEDEGVLVLSASQDYEPANELADTDLGGAHGAFTWALLHSLATLPVNSRIDRIFQRSRAQMQSKAPDQEPVLLAKKGRNERGLFGQEPETAHGLTAAVARVTGSTIKLNAGLAANLNEGCELKRIERGQPDVEIRITKLNGLSSSDAIITRKASENASVRPGDLFELVTWVAPDRELLRVHIPRPAPEPELRRLAEVASQLRKSSSINLVSDPTTEPPTHILSWDAGESQWSLHENRAGAQPTPIRFLSAGAVVRLLPQPSRLFVQFPPESSFARALKFEDGAVLAVDSPERADYVLLGRLESGSDNVSYAWALSDPGQSDHPAAKPPVRPLRSDWFPAHSPSEAVVSLHNTALGLAKVSGWLNLAPPVGDSAGPYQLVLRNVETGRIVSSGTVRDGESYKLLLRQRADASIAPVTSRRIYVFVVDSFGEAKLLFGDNLDNEFPRPGQPQQTGLVPLTTEDADLVVGTPYGIDSYFLLTSATPIDNPETVFNFAGVRSRGSGRPISSPLSRLLENTKSGKRGGVSGIPLDWSIEHLTLLSVPNPAK